MDMDRYWRWSNRRDEQIANSVVPICKVIERVLLRCARGNPELTAEVLDARAIREDIWGK